MTWHRIHCNPDKPATLPACTTVEELAQKVLSLAQEALGTGFDWRMVDRVYFLKGKMQDIEKLCQEQLQKGST